MSYYQKFGRPVFNSRIARLYLRWAYKKGQEDLTRLSLEPDFEKKDFNCLLCGVGSDQTADEFIKFVTVRAPQAKILIIDLGEEQLAAVKKLVRQKHSSSNITIKRLNALDLDSLIPKSSLDWIETDWFIEYFDSLSLKKLFRSWHGLLKPDGFITTRDFVSGNGITRITDAFRIWLAKRWLGVNLFRHTRKEFVDLFNECDFKFVIGPTPLPTHKRFTLVKRS